MLSSAKTSLALIAFAWAASAAACASSGSKPGTHKLEAMEGALRPASAEKRAAANRADPLTRANFWARENLKDGEDLTVSLEFARALREIGSEERAVDVLSRALIVHPKSAEALMLLGRIQMSQGDIMRAAQAFQRATDLEPARAEAWAALGTTYDRHGQHRLAQTLYQKALELEPARTTTLTNYGLSLVLTGDLAGAEHQLRLAAARPDANARVTENLALVLGLQGRFEEMKTVSRTAAPDEVIDQNAALLEGLIKPARSYEALVDAPARTPAPPLLAPARRTETDLAGEADKRMLRGLRN